MLEFFKKAWNDQNYDIFNPFLTNFRSTKLTFYFINSLISSKNAILMSILPSQEDF